MRTPRRRSLASIAVALVAGAIGIAGVAAAVPPSRSIAAASANRILARSMAAARAQHSVHAREVEHVGTELLIQWDNSNERSGEQVLSLSSGAVVDIRLFPRVLYVKANAKGIKVLYGKYDRKYANKWVSVRRAISVYRTLAEGIAFPSLLSQMPPSGPLAKSTVETIGRNRVIAISGRPNQVAQKVGGIEWFEVAAAAPHLPPRIVGHLRASHQTARIVITFSNWGHNFKIAAPSESVKITSTNLL